jgi:RNA polymerase sigma-70 factor (ECF subfamily)
MAPILAQGTRVDRSFERLYRRHARDVYRYALAVLQNPADAEDVTQTTFLNAYRALERGDRPRSARNWLIAIAHNVCRQRFRQSARRPTEVAWNDAADRLVEEDDAPNSDEIRRALSRLAFNQRAALVMRELEGRSYAEIAEVLGLSVGAVETLIFRARRALREQLEGTLSCREAELAISKQLDGRLSRADKGSLRAHLRECPECATLARRQRAQRGALRALGAVPLPATLASWLGGGGPAAGVVATKTAIVVAAAAVAGGTSYEVTRHAVHRLPRTPPPARTRTTPSPRAVSRQALVHAASQPSAAVVAAIPPQVGHARGHSRAGPAQGGPGHGRGHGHGKHGFRGHGFGHRGEDDGRALVAPDDGFGDQDHGDHGFHEDGHGPGRGSGSGAVAALVEHGGHAGFDRSQGERGRGHGEGGGHGHGHGHGGRGAGLVATPVDGAGAPAGEQPAPPAEIGDDLGAPALEQEGRADDGGLGGNAGDDGRGGGESGRGHEGGGTG